VQVHLDDRDAVAAAATKGNRGAQQASGIDLGALDEPLAEEVVAEA
jgi:small subunit ribosomal protein S2